MTLSPFEIDLDAILALPDGREKDEAVRQVAILKSRVEKNPLWSYMPHEGEAARKREHGEPLSGDESRGQVEFHEQSARGVFLAAVVAGNRFGKTHAGCVDNLIQLLPPEWIPPWLADYRRRPYAGDYHCRTVVVDLGTLAKVHLPKLRKLIPPEALFRGSFEKAWNDRNHTLSFQDGASWDFLSHDMDVDAFAGADLDRVHFDEEPPGDKGRLQFEESLARLIDRDGDVRFTLTPLLGLSWLYYELTRGDAPRKDDEVYVVEGSMEDNPTLSSSMQARLRKRYESEPLKLQARLHGRFVHFAGLIYEEFRESPPEEGGHVVPPRQIPREHDQARPNVPVYASIDPGWEHPMGLVFFWLSEQDVAEVFYAQKFKHWLLEDVAREFHRVCEEHKFRPRWVTIDPVARNKNPATGRNAQQELGRHGVHTLAGQNAVLPGIDTIKERLRSGRLLVHADQSQLIDEFKTYRWKNTAGQSNDAPKQEPIKVNDDLLDALRYGLMSMPVKAKTDRPDADAALDPHQRAFRIDLKKKLRGNRRQRVGSVR